MIGEQNNQQIAFSLFLANKHQKKIIESLIAAQESIFALTAQ